MQYNLIYLLFVSYVKNTIYKLKVTVATSADDRLCGNEFVCGVNVGSENVKSKKLWK